MKIKKLLLLIIMFLNFSVHGSTIYNFIKKVPLDEHGWFLSSNQVMLEKIIKERNPKIIIEIGSWLGASTRFLAQTSSSNSIVYAVDTWLGSDEEVHINDERVKKNKLFHIFLSNVIQANLQHKIIPIRMTSMEACDAFNGYADLIYIDGAHDEASVYIDIVKWITKLSPDGVICGDDWEGWPSVAKAVKRAAHDLNKEVVGYGNFWYFT